MKRVKIAIAGFGQIGPTHMNAYLKLHDKVDIVAIIDKDESRLSFAKEKYRINNLFTNYDEVFKIPDLDAVDICVPTYEHHNFVLKAAKHKKHIFCEKPMSLSVENTIEMETICKVNDLKLQLGFVRRFDNEWLKFKEIIDRGLLGGPVVWRSVSAGPGAPSPWFFEKKLGGGPFIDGAVHNYDFANYMFGKPKMVNGYGIKLQQSRSAIDTGCISILYKTGDILQMMWSWGLADGVHAGRIHDVLGPKGALCFKAVKKDPLEKDDASKEFLTIIRSEGIEENHSFKRNDMFEDELEHFADSILNDNEPLVGPVEGRDSLEVALAVQESLESGKPVYL